VIVAPPPIVALRARVLAIVLPIAAVLGIQIAAVGAIFAIVPVVVVMMVAIVHAELDGGLLRVGFGDDHGWCNNGSSQEK